MGSSGSGGNPPPTLPAKPIPEPTYTPGGPGAGMGSSGSGGSTPPSGPVNPIPEPTYTPVGEEYGPVPQPTPPIPGQPGTGEPCVHTPPMPDPSYKSGGESVSEPTPVPPITPTPIPPTPIPTEPAPPPTYPPTDGFPRSADGEPIIEEPPKTGPYGADGSYDSSFDIAEYRATVSAAIDGYEKSIASFPAMASICNQISAQIVSEDSNISSVVSSLGEVSNVIFTKCQEIRAELSSWLNKYAESTVDNEVLLTNELKGYGDQFSSYLSELQALGNIK
jgi:hypothetical protein